MKKPNRDFPASDIYLPRTGQRTDLPCAPTLTRQKQYQKRVCPSMKDIPLENPEDRTDQYRLLP